MNKLTRTLDCPHLHEHDSRFRLQGCILTGQNLQSLTNCHFPLRHYEQLGLDGCIALSASTPSPFKQKENTNKITERDQIINQKLQKYKYQNVTETNDKHSKLSYHFLINIFLVVEIQLCNNSPNKPLKQIKEKREKCSQCTKINLKNSFYRNRLINIVIESRCR